MNHKPKTNPEKLMKIMADHNLNRFAIANLLDVHLRTVGSWLAPESSNSYREMPSRWIDYLQLKIKQLPERD